MAISNSMKFRIDTLIDITNTSSRRQDDDKYAYKQEANFQTVLQTIGLRVNLNYDKSPSFGKLSVVKSSFGDKYIRFAYLCIYHQIKRSEKFIW